MKTIEEYMKSLSTIDFGEVNRTSTIYVGINSVKNLFFAKIIIEYEGKVFGYSAEGETIHSALLELIATLFIEYPLKENESLIIDGIDMGEVVNTKTFREWFSTF